jgi:dTDP-4-amino-4,6-dideoxygalactose transaminase
MTIEPTISAIPLVDLTRQYQSVKNEVDPVVQRILGHGIFASGEAVAAFEEEFARYCGVRHCICVNSGTSALHLAVIACGVQPGDEVITVPFTFIATAWSISYVGARPVFVDIDARNYTMDVDAIARAIGPKTRAIVPVHLYGQMADMEPIRDICNRHGLMLIEDAAQAHGARYKERRAGSYSDIGCFSFYPTKNLGACGEAGAITTNDDNLAQRVRRLRDHAQEEKYRHLEVGYNYRMDEMQAAILSIKLRHLDRWNQSRSRIARHFLEKLAQASLVLPLEERHRNHVWHQFVIRSPRRDILRDVFAKNAIATGLHYPIPLHLQPAYRHLGYHIGDFPVAEEVARECLSLPMFPELDREEIDRICNVVLSANPNESLD